ncbi:MAG: HEAT repeat domain-containing protein [Polyangiales bacterium]
MIATVRLFNPKGPDRVAVVTVRAAWGRPGEWTVQVARGPNRLTLTQGSTHGPYTREALPDAHAAVIASLKAGGFQRSGLRLVLAQLKSEDVKTRAHAAGRLGWMAEPDAVPALLEAAKRSESDLSNIVDALGRIGDPRGVDLAREESERKLLSRRRAGVEALRNLGDSAGLDAAVTRALARLPDVARDLIESADPDDTDPHTLDAVDATLKGVELKDTGLILDALYEVGTPLCVALARRRMARGPVGRAYVWRYVKSIYKRAMLRGDADTFAELALRFERRSPGDNGVSAKVKSGLDGQTRTTKIFTIATQKYVRRVAWRHLRALGRWRPEQFTRFAAALLAGYRDTDKSTVKGSGDVWARATLLNHLLRAGDPRFHYDWHTLKFTQRSAKAPAPDARTEAFPEAWDAHPDPLLDVLVGATVAEVHEWASAAVAKRHPTVVHRAPIEKVLRLLDAPVEATVRLGVDELGRRFDPQRPDWALLDRLACDARPVVQDFARRFITETVSVLEPRPRAGDRAPTDPDATTRTLVAGLLTVALGDAPAEFRVALAADLLALLRAPETFEGSLDGVSRVVRDALVKEVGATLSLDEVLALVNQTTLAAQSAGGALLAGRADAFETLGMRRVVVMATHEVAAVRQAAHALLAAQTAALNEDPSVLFALVESEWADTRAFAFDMLRRVIDVAKLGLQGVLALCDSNRADVQGFGREMALAHFDSLDAQALLRALSEHPAPDVRRFALDLATAHLKDGFIALARLEDYFRRAMLDLRPSRVEKRRVVEFLLERGMRDERQAAVAARVLGDVVRTKTRDDFERVMDALLRLRLQYPELETPLEVRA